MINQSSINLCDYRGTYDSFEVMLEKYDLYNKYLDSLDFSCENDEVWLGSEFCENLFLCCSIENYQEKINYFTTCGLKVKIAVPELHELHFNDVMCMLEQMKDVDGYIVNDIGTALRIHQKFPQKKMILGRSFDKSIREIRLKPYEICKKFEREQANIYSGIQDNAHVRFFESIGASGITTDSVPFVVSKYDRLNFPVYFQYPRILLSQASICEFSQVEGNNPLKGCKLGCFYYAKDFDLAGMSAIKMGKIIWHKEERAIDQCVSGNVRLVYTI